MQDGISQMCQKEIISTMFEVNYTHYVFNKKYLIMLWRIAYKMVSYDHHRRYPDIEVHCFLQRSTCFYAEKKKLYCNQYFNFNVSILRTIFFK